MRPLHDVTAVLGSLALAGTLALLSPGVHAVRADDDATPAESSIAAEGPTCQAGRVSSGEEIVEFLQLIQHLQMQRMAASPDAADTAGDFVVLNNRGYNYGSAGVALPAAIEHKSR